MEMINVCVIIGSVLGFYLFVRKLNEIWYFVKLGRKVYKSLPPGDLGWPFVGSSLSFYRASRLNGDPNSFIQTLLFKNGRVGIHKCHLLGKPTIIVTDSEICRRVYLDDEKFKLDYPKSFKIFGGDGNFIKIDHKIGYRMMTSTMNGYEVLSNYVDFIEQIMSKGLEEWSSMREPIELLDEIGYLFLKVILHIFMGTQLDAQTMAELHALFTEMGLVILTIFPYDLPGFNFHKAVKAKRKIQNILHCVIEEKRRRVENDKTSEVLCQVDKMILATDENGAKLYDNNTIIDMLLSTIFAGHSSPGIVTMWALIHISENPQILQKAKEEQESIIRQRPSTQKGLTYKEIKEMKYLTKIINEVLRRNTATITFRKANEAVNINGYTIPKGWTIQIWGIAVHMDSQIYSNPQEFDPSRWNNYTPKRGEFIPFGIGSRFCPGSELTKLEIAILLHHFILNYKMERVNPKCNITGISFPKPIDNCLSRITRLP